VSALLYLFYNDWPAVLAGALNLETMALAPTKKPTLVQGRLFYALPDYGKVLEGKGKQHAMVIVGGGAVGIHAVPVKG
tara:strand:- start:7062 stop:7295 length:234 start_codon:yes stop_codon:yes gene_type:complete